MTGITIYIILGRERGSEKTLLDSPREAQGELSGIGR
jgi:hypothetical protein